MSNQKKIRILIAEDDYMVGKSTAALLRKMGYTIAGQALNGREAVEMTQSLRPDVVLMDLKMPIMDGIEATKHIYETCPTPVVALTAYATPQVIEQAIEAGMGGYLTKPASVQEIDRAINVTIARFDDMVELRRLNAELQAEIAERKRAEELLRESEEKYRTILENIEDSYFEVDIAGNLTFFNDPLCRLLGYSEDELMGMNNRQYMDDVNAEALYQTFNTVYRTGKPARAFDWEVIRKDGTRRFVEASVSLIRDPTGEPAGFRGVVRDVTERKQAEEEIKQRNRELAALNAITAAMMQSALNLDEVLQRTADGIVEGLGCNTAFILLLDEEKKVFKGSAISAKAKILAKMNALIGFPLLQIKVPARSDFNEAMGNLLNNRITIKHDFYDLVSPYLGKRVCFAIQRLMDSKTFFTMPLLAKGKTIGGIIASTPDKLAEKDTDRLMTFANQAAIAIENARLYQETQQRALEQETLREAALALTTALDRNKVIERILAQLQRVAPYDSASVQLLRENHQMELVGGRGFPNLPDLLGITFPADGDNPNSEVVRTRAPFIVDDAPTVYEGFRKDPHRQISIRSWLGVPMLIGEQLVGMIALDKREPGFYTGEHARLAEVFAAQAAVAIENARLFEETEQRVAELEVLRRTSLQLTSSLDLADVLDSIAENGLSLVGANNCHIYLYDETSEVFTFGAALWQDGRREAAVKTPRRDGLTATVARKGQAVIINDAPRHPFYASPETQKWGLQAIAGIPLKRAERVVGVFSIAFLTPHTFSQEELRVLSLLADQAAIAIENARLFTEAEQRATELSTMLEAARAVSSTLNLEQVLALIAEQMAKAVAVAGCTLSRWDREADTIMTLTEWRQRQAEWGDEPGISYALDDFPATRAVLEKRQPITILATDPDAEPAEVAFMQQAGVVSLLMLPLVVGEQVIGLVELDETEREREFTDAEIRLCQALANQVAVAIENARLYEGEKRRATQLALINEVGEKAASILDSDNKMMQEVTHSIQKSFNYYNAVLLLFDDERRDLVMQAIAGGFEHEVGGAYRQSMDEGIIGFVARTGKSWLANDVSKDPYYIKGFAAKEILTGSELCVPVKLGDKVIGVLDVHSIHLNDFSQADVVAMEAVADRVAIAIENARLFEEEKRRATQLALINEVGEKAASILDSDKMMQEVTRSIQKSFNYYNVTLLLLDDERRELVMQAIAGGLEHMVPEEYRQSIDRGIAGFVARTGKPWLASDVSQDPYYIRGLSSDVLTESELYIPIKLGDKAIGVLGMQSTHLNDFNQADVVAMEAVADRVAIAIQNARLFEETQWRATQLQTIEEIGRRVSAILDPAELFTYVTEAIQQNFSYYHVDIFLVDPATGYAVFKASSDPATEKVWKEQGLRFKIGEQGMIGWAAQTGDPFLVNDVSQEPRYLPDELLPETKSELVVPLKVGGQVVGALDVASNELNAFAEDDLFVLQTLSNQIATAIENARLFQETEERRVYLEAVLGAAPDAIVTLDAHHRVVEWNSGAERLFGYSREEAIGRELDRLVTKPDIFEEAVEFTQVVMSGMELPPVETIRYRKDDSPVDVLVAGSSILVGDESIGAVAVYTDITARKRMEETLRALALLDELTGLYNRRGFSTLGQQQLKAAHRAHRGMLLLFADFDGLKQINDAFGHSEGDRALVEVANILDETFRESDIIARIGGDEFVVLAIETDSVGPKVLAIRLQERLEARNAKGVSPYKLSLSVGIAHYNPDNPCSIDELLARADRAMYEKKRGDTPG